MLERKLLNTFCELYGSVEDLTEEEEEEREKLPASETADTLARLIVLY